MMLEAIYHLPYSEYAFPVKKCALAVRLKTKKGDLKNVSLIYHEKYDSSINGRIPMEKTAWDGMFDYYEAVIDAGIKRFKYMFCLEGWHCTKWYNANGFFDSEPGWGHFTYSCICEGDMPEIPGWFEKSVIYQIFPDRFSNPSIESDTGKQIKRSQHGTGGYSRYGGTLKGIYDKLEYLLDLGVDTIYFNPIFEATSYHRYDTTDYFKIDPSFGDNGQFRDFVARCHTKGIRVILDGVFNHCSMNFYPFRDVMSRGENSRYRDWFFIKSFPVKAHPTPNYECFGFYRSMPKFNLGNEDVVKYLLSIGTFWIKNYDIDGWRLDVADELDRRFLRLLRKEVRALKTDAVLIGEVWDEAPAWLNGDQFHSVTNYPLKSLMNDLFAYSSISLQQFREKLSGLLMAYNPQVVNTLVNITGTHDTPRFMTLCGGNRQKYMLGAVFQFTFPGIPLVYYGDEIGMQGGGDPDCRRPMIWDESCRDVDMYRFYKFLAGLRKRYSALCRGVYRELSVSGSHDVMAFKRKDDAECLLVVINTGDRQADICIGLDGVTDDGGELLDLRTDRVLKVSGRVFATRLGNFEWNIYKVLNRY